MKIQLNETKYGGYVRKLGDLSAYWADTGLKGEWFSSEEEARQAALKHHQFMLGTYTRICPGKKRAVAAIITLGEEHD